MHRLDLKSRIIGIALVVALLASLGVVSATTLAVVDQEILVNGNFEGGFSHVPGCGVVGSGWGCFTNGGTVDYGFYDDTWAPVVADGGHSQLIELNTIQYAASESDRYAGIYQAVHLLPGHTYHLKLSGLMRERDPNPDEDKYRYRVQWGYTSNGSKSWADVTNWQELPWDKIDNRISPTGMESFSTSFVAPSADVTLFFRVWKKWGTAYKELDVNLDAISLFGPKKGVPVKPPKPDKPSKPLACAGPNLVHNGDFEGGFTNGVGNGWHAFNNGGAAVYGYYDDMWPPVVKDGTHSQLIEINTWGMAASDTDRVAGIWQVAKGLKPGALYEFSLWGMIREEAAHPEEDDFRYRVQWGYAPASATPGPAEITHWTELPWDTIYERTSPGDLSSYSVQFKAPSKDVVIAVRAWKKWGTIQRELDVNLDAIRLVGCGAPPPPPVDGCIYVVKRGDTLGLIAARYHTTVAWLAKANHIKNVNLIRTGQKLHVPCAAPAPYVVDEHPPVVVVKPPVTEVHPLPPPPPPPDGCWYKVVRGDTLYKIARQHNVNLAELIAANSIANPNRIYVGQEICIP